MSRTTDHLCIRKIQFKFSLYLHKINLSRLQLRTIMHLAMTAVTGRTACVLPSCGSETTPADARFGWRARTPAASLSSMAKTRANWSIASASLARPSTVLYSDHGTPACERMPSQATCSCARQGWNTCARTNDEVCKQMPHEKIPMPVRVAFDFRCEKCQQTDDPLFASPGQ